MQTPMPPTPGAPTSPFPALSFSPNRSTSYFDSPSRLTTPSRLNESFTASDFSPTSSLNSSLSSPFRTDLGMSRQLSQSGRKFAWPQSLFRQGRPSDSALQVHLNGTTLTGFWEIYDVIIICAPACHDRFIYHHTCCSVLSKSPCLAHFRLVPAVSEDVISKRNREDGDEV